MIPITNNWKMDKAEDDLASSRCDWDAGRCYNALYSMQQSVEHILKAVIEVHGCYTGDVQVHDIGFLVDKINAEIKTVTIPDIIDMNADYITEWESRTRYDDTPMGLIDIPTNTPLYMNINNVIDDWVFNLRNYGVFE